MGPPVWFQVMKITEAHPSPTQSPSNSFRLRLQSELAERCAGNSQYSLRSFALHLDIDHSTLSQLLRGKRRLTEATIHTLGSALKLSRDEVDAYLAHHRRWPVADPSADEATRLTRDAAEMIADWYHYAILELTRLESFRADSSWVARVLGISTDEVNVALVRLCHLGLLAMEGSRWVDRSEGRIPDVRTEAYEGMSAAAEGGRHPGGPEGQPVERAATAESGLVQKLLSSHRAEEQRAAQP